jgi:hypothetical protein
LLEELPRPELLGAAALDEPPRDDFAAAFLGAAFFAPPFFAATFLDAPFLAATFLGAAFFAAPLLTAPFFAADFLEAAFLLPPRTDALFEDLDAPFEPPRPEDEPPLELPPRLDDLTAPFFAAPFFDEPFDDDLPPELLLLPFLAAAFLVDFAIVNGFLCEG